MGRIYVLFFVCLRHDYVSKNVSHSMERVVIEQFIEWKNKSDRKPLIVNGARQVGKTWLLKEFGKREYLQTAYITCYKNNLVKEIFSTDYDTKRIITALGAVSRIDIKPESTLIILDEVQEIPEVLESLKYFCEDAPQYHIAVAGSLLGISLHKGFSFPVGKVQTINIYPMSYEEFLLAKGENQLFNILESKDFKTINMLHEKYVDLLRQYYYVGGMPEAVKQFVETGELMSVRSIQKQILSDYSKDFSKHAPKELVPRITMVWQSIPSQLFKENKKFIYGTLKKGARANDFELAIQWLLDAGLIYKVPRVKALKLPLKIYEDLSAFKMYMVDTGLLGAMVDVEPSQILINNNIFSEYKGGMTEQYVLQQMKSHGTENIYYHNTDSSRLEIDFIIQREGNLLPIEVKAESNVRANSLSMLLQNTPDMQAIRYSMLPYCEQSQMTNIPMYAV